MIIINYSHPLSEGQIAQVEQLAGQPVERVITLPVQFDITQPFTGQLSALQGRLGLSPEELQTKAVIIHLPAISSIAGAIIADLHGRMGYFPPILRLKKVDDLPPKFEVAEIINLQALRDSSRKARQVCAA